MAAQETKEEPKKEIKHEVVSDKRKPEKDLFSWQAPARPFKRRTREFWVSVIAAGSVLSFIFFITEGIMPVILIISVVFLLYVLSTVEPEEIEYKITTWGVKVADKRADWENIGTFWFSKRLESNLLIFSTYSLPGRLELVIKENDKSALKKAITNHAEENEAPPTNLDKAANWLAKKLPGTEG